MRDKRNYREKMFKKNLTLFKVHLQEVVKNPQILEKIPNNSHLVLIPKNDKWLKRRNLKLAEKLLSEGKEIILLPTNKK